eukprot:2675617-Prymnesium_polylepis.1
MAARSRDACERRVRATCERRVCATRASGACTLCASQSNAASGLCTPSGRRRSKIGLRRSWSASRPGRAANAGGRPHPLRRQSPVVRVPRPAAPHRRGVVGDGHPAAINGSPRVLPAAGNRCRRRWNGGGLGWLVAERRRRAVWRRALERSRAVHAARKRPTDAPLSRRCARSPRHGVRGPCAPAHPRVRHSLTGMREALKSTKRGEAYQLVGWPA